MFCFAGLCELFTTKHVCQVLIVSCVSSPDLFAQREEEATHLTTGQEAQANKALPLGSVSMSLSWMRQSIVK